MPGRQEDRAEIDCGHCGCPQSTNDGKHTRAATGEHVTIGKLTLMTYKCSVCGAYLDTA